MNDYYIKKDRTNMEDIILTKEQVNNSAEIQNSSDMYSLTVIYHEDFEDEVIGMLSRTMTITRYTKIRDVAGARADTLNNEGGLLEIGRNHMLIVVGIHSDIHEIANSLRNLREIKGHGIRGYVTQVENLI